MEVIYQNVTVCFVCWGGMRMVFFEYLLCFSHHTYLLNKTLNEVNIFTMKQLYSNQVLYIYVAVVTQSVGQKLQSPEIRKHAYHDV